MYRKRDSFSDLKITYDRITSKGTTKVVEGKAMRIWGQGKKSWRVGVGTPVSVFHGKKVDRNHPEYVGHPTQKPEKLIAELIMMATEEGDWILDPFSGSGTVSAVARRLGRKSIAIEIEDKWIDIIAKRVDMVKKKRSIDDFLGLEVDEEKYEQYLEERELTEPERIVAKQEKLQLFTSKEEEP